MTEEEWLGCMQPEAILMFLRGKTSERKMRLFAAACCRRIWHLLVDQRTRDLVPALEQYADALIRLQELSAACRQNAGFIQTAPWHTYPHTAAIAIAAAAGESPWAAGWNVVSEVRRALNDYMERNGMAEARQQVWLLQDIMENPFRAVILDPSWSRWQDGTVVKLAQAIYDDRQFGDLPILGDALEEAGCMDGNILNHCRQPRQHVLGCWVLDLLLGRK